MRFVFLALCILGAIGGLVLSGYLYVEEKIRFEESNLYFLLAVPFSLVLSTVFYYLYSKVKYKDVENREKEIKKESALVASQREELKSAKYQIEEIEQLNKRN